MPRQLRVVGSQVARPPPLHISSAARAIPAAGTGSGVERGLEKVGPATAALVPDGITIGLELVDGETATPSTAATSRSALLHITDDIEDPNVNELSRL